MIHSEQKGHDKSKGVVRGTAKTTQSNYLNFMREALYYNRSREIESFF